MSSLRSLKDVVERASINPRELGSALSKANQSYCSLIRLLEPYIRLVEESNERILRSGGPVNPNQSSANLECLIDFIDEYVKAEPKDRKKRITLFEESYQISPGELTEFLKYLGLDI